MLVRHAWKENTGMKLPKGLTIETVLEAAKSEMFGLDNPGFCLACGARDDSCEPDACNYECEECGEREVFGAAQILLEVGG